MDFTLDLTPQYVIDFLQNHYLIIVFFFIWIIGVSILLMKWNTYNSIRVICGFCAVAAYIKLVLKLYF